MINWYKIITSNKIVKYEKNNWYKKYALNEEDIEDLQRRMIEEKEKLFQNENYQAFNNIFGNKKRIIIPLMNVRLIKIINKLKERGYEFDENFEFLKKENDRRQYKPGKIIEKELGKKIYK